jgi:hypothetical protein
VADDETAELTDQDNPLDFEFADGWPDDVQEAYRTLFSFDLERLEGREIHGSLAFTELTPVVGRVKQILRDLAMESWADLPDDIAGGGLIAQVNALNATLEEIAAFDIGGQSEPATAKNQLVQRLHELAGWFKNTVRPQTVTAQVQREIANATGTDGAVSEAAVLREEIKHLRLEHEKVARDLEARKDLVESLRTVSGKSASDDLSAVFMGRADKLSAEARRWLTWLGVSGAIAIGGAIASFFLISPHNSGQVTGEDIGRITLAAFIVGLLAYAVRTCALQYRASRHLEAIARSKAAALSTFTRFSAAIAEESVRSTVALVLAQAVFATEDTGFVDASADRVTLMDHALPRIVPGTGGAVTQ